MSLAVWTCGDLEGDVLVIARSPDDVAAHLGVLSEQIRQANEIPIEAIRRELGGEVARALLGLVQRLFPSRLPDPANPIDRSDLRPWRRLGDDEFIFLSRGGLRLPIRAEEAIARFGPGRLATRRAGRWNVEG